MDQSVVLWPEGAPLAVGGEEADIPRLVVRPPAGAPSGGAMVLCPGGAYRMLAEVENGPIWQWLNTLGVTVFALRYRLGTRYQHPAPLLDASRAVRTVRHRAAEWGVDPARVGIIGFSAGGHLAATLATHFDYGRVGAEDPVERESCRPDAVVLGYPVISMGEIGHAGSRRHLLGRHPASEDVQSLSNERHVSPETPPAFLVHGVDDASVMVENSLTFGRALREAGVPFEMHLFERGRHGFSLGEDDPGTAHWPSLCAAWLRRRGIAR